MPSDFELTKKDKHSKNILPSTRVLRSHTSHLKMFNTPPSNRHLSEINSKSLNANSSNPFNSTFTPSNNRSSSPTNSTDVRNIEADNVNNAMNNALHRGGLEFSNISKQNPCCKGTQNEHNTEHNSELQHCRKVIHELSQKLQEKEKELYLKNVHNSKTRFQENTPINNRTVNEHSELESDNSSYCSSNYNRRRYQHRQVKCEMNSWPIKFSSGNGLKFFKRVEKLQRSYDYDDDMIYKYFHLLLDGQAMEWYWQFCDEFEEANLAVLRTEFCRVFKSIDSDMSMISKMYSRKQGRDSFEKFYNDIIDKNFDLKEPLPDEQIIEILRSNMEDDIRQRIFTFDTNDRIKFYHKANAAYLDVYSIREKRKMYYDKPFTKRVNEIDFDELSSTEIEEISSKINNWKIRKSTKCFNCKSVEHILSKCPEEITRFFCFKCGLEGVATPKCPNCNLNYKRSA